MKNQDKKFRSAEIKKCRAKMEELRRKRDLDLVGVNDPIEEGRIYQGWQSESWEYHEELAKLTTEVLIEKAHFWRVPIPSITDYARMRHDQDENWKLTNVLHHQVLTESGQQRIRQSIWQRKVEVAVIIFGISSVVQTIYTVLAYYQ